VVFINQREKLSGMVLALGELIKAGLMRADTFYESALRCSTRSIADV
jgi:hypothetical protein